MKKDLLVPTYEFRHYSDISVEFLKKEGVSGILTDLDDTLTSHNCPDPDEKLTSWLASLKRAGIAVCIVSNNTRRRTAPFAEQIGVGFICNAAKPYRPRLKKALSVVASKPENTVFIGDQLYTDISGANRLGIRSILVTPVGGGKTTAFIRFKRKLEARRARKLQNSGDKKESAE